MIKLKKIKKIAVLVEEGYQDLEVWYPILRLREEGMAVIIIGPKSDVEYKGKFGYPVRVNIGIERANPDEFDAVVIPGGWAPDYLRRHDKINEFVSNMSKKGKIVASICHGASVLVSANVLKGKNVTCFFSIKDDVVNAGAAFLDEEVVIDGNLITSRKPDDLPAFCKAMIRLLSKE